MINKRGTSLVEVLIALFILVISGTAITTLLITSMHAASISAEKLVATNLAREGVEGVINMVNTNWLRFPSNSDCWNTIDKDTTDVDSCNSDEIKDSDYYILKLYDGPDDSPFKWMLKKVGGLDTEELKLGVNEDSKMQKYCLQDYQAYESRKGLLLQDENKTYGDCTKYYRQITVGYPSGEDGDVMEITAKVQWLHSSQPKTVKLTTTLYNDIY
jgi:type II secretory pathway pseudopilin PulG